MYRAGQEIKKLDPEGLRFLRQQKVTEGLCLQIVDPKTGDSTTFSDVSVHYMFPLSHPGKLITLCDRNGEEIGVLDDISDLDEGSKQALWHELTVNYFVPKITRIVSIKEEFGITHWEVETDRGPRRFQLQSRYDIRSMGGGRYIIRDIDGNRYDIPNEADLDPVSRSLLELEV
ncbi:MAG TPA: DUF1854 domain-containing protein [Firmicutes bacterium]|nr:DUF1854 domain-containing protein [Bacillota bacterium]